MTDDVAVSWARIDGWLRRNAPSYHARLRPGATAAAVDRFEAAVGLTIPADLRMFWLAADGFNDAGDHPTGRLIPPLWDPLSIDAALSLHRIRRDVTREFAEWADDIAYLDAAPAGTTDTLPIWLTTFIPLGGGTDGVLVDCRPGPLHGCILEHDHIIGQFSPPAWPGVAAMLGDIAERLDRIDVTAFGPDDAPEVDGWLIPWA